MGNLIRTAALLLATLALSGCAIFSPPTLRPEVSLYGIALESLALTEQVFRARLVVSNPNEQRLKVSNALVNLRLEGIDLGTGETVSGVSVPGYGREYVDIRIVTNLWQSAPQLWTWLNSGDAMLDYRVDGFVNLGLAGLARLRIDETGQMDTRQLFGQR